VEPLHRLLRRQLKRYKGDLKAVPDEWRAFIHAVNEAYRQFDEDRTMLERSMELSSQELLHANSALQAAGEERFNATFNQAAVGLAHVSAQGQFIRVNSRLCEMLGYSEADLKRKTVKDLSFPEDRNITDDLARRLRSGAIDRFSVEKRYLHSSGAPLWVNLTVAQVRRPDGQLDYDVSVVEDISERKHAEQALVQLRRQNDLILDSVGEGIHGIDTEGRIFFENTASAQLLGYSVKELVGTPAHATMHHSRTDGTAYPVADCPIYSTLRDGAARSVEGEVFWRKDGSSFPVEYTTNAIRNERGAITGTVVVFQDITERKRADRMFKELLELAPDAMVLADPEGEIVLVNNQAVKLFGWRREELLGQKIEILVPERYRGKHPERRSGFFAHPHQRPMGAELKLFGLRKDGTEFPVESSLSPLETDEGMLVMSAIRDITERRNAEAALLESRRMLRLVLDTIPARVFWKDTGSNFLGCNQSFAMDAGLRSPEELVGKNDTDMGWADQADAYRADDRLIMDIGKPRLNYEEPQTTPDGRTVWLRTSKVPLPDARGNIAGILGTYEDVTEQKQAEVRVKHLNRVYAVLSGINTLIVRVRNRDELFAEACAIAVEAGGFRMSMLCLFDRSTTKIVPVASAGKDEELLAAIKNTLSSNEVAPKTLIARAIREKKAVVANDTQSDPNVLFGARYAAAEVRSMVVFPLIVADEAVGVLALYAGEPGFFDEQEMKLLTELAGDIAFAIDHLDKQARLDYLAYYDELTGLANRTLFLERVAQYIRSAAISGHKIAVGLIDLERFKNINDSLGRPAGDALLKQVAEWLTLNMGDVNLLARIDADHFAAVLPDIKEEGEVTQFVEKSLQAFLDHPFDLTGDVFRIAAKVGVALFPDDGADAETLFRNAEAALKKAKASGERYLFHTQKMTDAVAVKLTLENRLRQALDKQEFVLHYQPKVNLASGKVTSAEALIRWNDPRTGLVPPGRFIPVLEETGLIYDVGRWALRKAVEEYSRWRAAGLPAVRIAVNVSPLQLRQRGFVDEVRQVIGSDAHAAEGLELEITESLIMEDIKGNIASLGAIRDLGVSIAIDDFGTGFSSLSYLARLPVHTLKIDRSFVIDMTAGPQGLALVSTIITLAHSLKLKVVAEGVETEEQSRLLRLLACDEMQGFLFSTPVPRDIFETRFLAVPSAAEAVR